MIIRSGSGHTMKPGPRLLWIMTAGIAVAALLTLFGEALWPLPLVMGVLVVIALGWDALSLIRGRLRLKLAVPGSAGVGDEPEIGIRIESSFLFPMTAVLRAEVSPPLQQGPDRRIRIFPGRQDAVFTLNAPRRGVGKIKAIWIQLQGPMGFILRVIRLPVHKTEIAVIPNMPQVRRMAIEHFGTWRYRGGVRLTRLRGVGSEFDALETYVPGMDPRHVDWKTSARHNALRVRRYRVEQNQRIVISLDSGRLMADPIEGIQRLDHAIHAFLLMSYFALRDGDQVGIHAYGAEPRVWVPAGGGMRHLSTLIKAMSDLQPRDEETNHVLGLQKLLTRLRRRTLVVVLTEFSDTTTAELMIEYVGLLARQHLVIFVALEDPFLEGALDQRTRTPRALARALAMQDLQKDRSRVLHRLRRHGVHVVSGTPGMAAIQLVSQYTQIKRKELIG